MAEVVPAVTQAESSSSSSAVSSQRDGAIAFSGCMRSHGVSNFPDPTSDGAIPKVGLEQLGVSGTRFQAAQRSCQHLLPNGGGPTVAELEQGRALALRFAHCMRNDGVTNFPDPGADGRIPDPASLGIDQGAPRFQVANQACREYRPPYIPSNADYDSWARTHGA